METDRRISIGCRVPASWVAEIDRRATALGSDRAAIIAAAIAAEIGKPAPLPLDARVRAVENRLRAISSALSE